MVTVLKKCVFLCLPFLLAGSAACLAKTRKPASTKGNNNNPQYASTLTTATHEYEKMESRGQVLRQAPADSTIIHIVKKGETLYSISNEYGVSVEAIKRWNGLTDNSIQIGEKLKIYPQKAAPDPVSSRAQIGSETGGYTVKPGDTLYHIAQMFQTSVEQLKALNNLSSNTIRVGQVLKVATVKSTEKRVKSAVYGKFIRYAPQHTVARDSLLAKFEMGIGEFLALNPGVKDTTIHAGEEVKVLVPPKNLRKNPYRVTQNVKKLGIMVATKYPPNSFGTTTNGELYNPKALTAGSPTLEIGTIIFVKNKRNGRGVFVRINDRINGKGLKLSKAAWNVYN